ncbi:MAG: hypothetical protein H6943_04450 [Zoogloeaceae bacterium]|nr:hypothetical protein [Zoogloeaceae bacterium]
MSQQINLINTALRPKQHWLSFNNVAMATGVSVLLIVGLTAYASFSASRALAEQQAVSTQLIAVQQELQQVQATLATRKTDPVLERELADVSASLAHRRNVLRLAEESATRGDVGLAEMMRGFSRQVLDGVWLTGINLGSSGMDIRGRLLEPSLLPAYIRRLNEEPAFRGRLFAALDMNDVPPEAPKLGANGLPLPAAPDAVAGDASATARIRFTEFALRASSPPVTEAKP